MASPALTAAVKKQLGASSKKEFLETLKDVTRGGADAGFGGFTYHTETCGFAKKHFKLIMEQLREDLDSFGEPDTVAEMIASFKYIKQQEISPSMVEEILMSKDDESDDGVAVFNTLAWYALENVAFDHDR